MILMQGSGIHAKRRFFRMRKAELTETERITMSVDRKTKYTVSM